MLQPSDFLLNAGQFLYMVANFMGEHIRFSKLAARTEALAELIIKAQVDINLFIRWAIERTGCGTR